MNRGDQRKGASTMKLNGPHYKAHCDDEGIDRIEIALEPRYKTSGLSGDEWRTSARVTFYRKGQQVGDIVRGSLRTAVDFLPADMHQLPELVAHKVTLWGFDGNMCMQPSCFNPATVVYRLREEYSSRGEGPLPRSGFEQRRAFCDEHKTRGDCGLEDADRNYEMISGQ